MIKSSDGSNTILSNIKRTPTSFYEHRMIKLEHPTFGFQRKNIEPNRAFTRFTELLIELTRTTFFQISNELERVHLLVIKLKHPIFGFERSKIELRTLFNASLIKRPKILEHYIRMVNVHIDTYTVRCTIHEPCLITRCWLPALTSITNFVLEIDCIVGNYFAGRVRH